MPEMRVGGSVSRQNAAASGVPLARSRVVHVERNEALAVEVDVGPEGGDLLLGGLDRPWQESVPWRLLAPKQCRAFGPCFCVRDHGPDVAQPDWPDR